MHSIFPFPICAESAAIFGVTVLLKSNGDNAFLYIWIILEVFRLTGNRCKGPESLRKAASKLHLDCIYLWTNYFSEEHQITDVTTKLPKKTLCREKPHPLSTNVFLCCSNNTILRHFELFEIKRVWVISCDIFIFCCFDFTCPWRKVKPVFRENRATINFPSLLVTFPIEPSPEKS